MRIPTQVTTISTSIILTLSALTLFLAPVQIVQALIYRQGLPLWYPMVIIGTILLRSVISFGLFERKSWAWLLYSLDKILFLTLYGARFVQAETLPYAQEARDALFVPALLSAGKLLMALLAYKEFTPNFKKHLIELWKNWRETMAIDRVVKEVKSNNFIKTALILYFSLTLGTQTMGQLYRAILLWANPLQTQFPWLKLTLLLSNDNFWAILMGSTIFFALASLTSLRQRTWGWKIIITTFVFAFLFALPRDLRLLSSQMPENFWIRRTETLLSFIWLAGSAFWLSQPQKAQGSSWQNKKRKV